jgi:hypothetical protein
MREDFLNSSRASFRTRRRLATAVFSATVAAFGGLQVAAAPETESEICRQKSGGTLSMDSASVTWGQQTSVSWTAQLVNVCADAGPTLDIVDDGGTVVYKVPDAFDGQGTASITPTRVGSLHLRLGTFGGSRELASTGVTVGEPGPLQSGETSVQITGSDIAQRLRLVQAMRTDNMTVTIAGTLEEDLSGLGGIHLGKNVHVIGDRSVVNVGPRLFTTTDPRAFLIVDQDGVRITGIRVDGQESLDPFANVGLPDTAGIQVEAAVNVEIDHDEIFRWRGAGIDVRDGNGANDSAYTGRLNRDNVEDNDNNVWVHDNYIHHNQHPSAENCISGSGHAGGYGVEAADGGYVKIERNVFDWNRHSIAGDGKYGTGYVARDNLILQNGGVHFKCVDPDSSLWVFVANPFAGIGYVVEQMLDPDHIYHTHAIDMHGTNSDCGTFSGDHNCGPAGEYMDISYNTILYTQGNGIHLRGTPSVGMFVRGNVFAHSEHDGSLLTPGAMVQNELGLYDQGNTLGLNTFNERKSCDFDGDGVGDPMIATGVAWWYASSALGGRWVFLKRSPKRLADLVLRDVDGHGRCDVSETVLVPVPNMVGLDRISGAGVLGHVGLLLGNERDVVVPLCDDRIDHITAQGTPPGTAVPVGTSINYEFGVKPSGNFHCQ